MPGTELRGPSAHTRIGTQRGRLRNAAIVFEQISSDVGAKRDTWITAVNVAMNGLADAWEEHVTFTEGPDGLFEELLGESVEVAPEIDRLRRDHEVLVAHIARTRELLAQPTAGPDDTRVLLALTGIAKLVDNHRRRGADLLYRVYSVDLSAGD
jgi:Hemerythrin HHE cation binding domain